MRIVRLANFVAPHSGGLRTSLRELGAGYLAAGHDPVLIIPGERVSDAQTPQGRVITLSGPPAAGATTGSPLAAASCSVCPNVS